MKNDEHDPYEAWTYRPESMRVDLPLSGVRLGVKDTIDVKGMPTARGFRGIPHEWAGRDATVVSLLRSQGVQIVGKTVTTEFAGPESRGTRNPHDPARTAGGSSSGSAAAVAAGEVDIALGSQTAGSVIRPAAFCGVVGFKPTHGLLSTAGVTAMAPSLDTVGILGRTVDLVADATMAAADFEELPGSGQKRRSVFASTLTDCSAAITHDVTRQAVQQAEECLAADGMQKRKLPDGFEDLLAESRRTHAVILGFESVRNLAPELREFEDKLGEQTRAFVATGRKVTDKEYFVAIARAEELRAQFDAALCDVDVLLTPAAPGPAPKGLDWTGDFAFNIVWTLLHAPCVTVPILRDGDSMPVGVQIVAGRLNDRMAIDVARRCLVDDI